MSQAFEKEADLSSDTPATGLEARLMRVEHLLQQVLDRDRTDPLDDEYDHAHEDSIPVSETCRKRFPTTI